MSDRITITRTLRRKLENTEVTVVYSGIVGKKTGFYEKSKDRFLTIEEAERIVGEISSKEKSLLGYDEIEFEIILTKYDTKEQESIKRIIELGKGYKGRSLRDENIENRIEEMKEEREKQKWKFLRA